MNGDTLREHLGLRTLVADRAFRAASGPPSGGSDGRHRGLWSSDQELLQPGKGHHVAVIVDGGPDIISYVVVGQVCDGGRPPRYGWGRFTPLLSDVNGSPKLRIAPSLHGKLQCVRI